MLPRNSIIILTLVVFLHMLTACVSTSESKVVPEEVAKANVNLASEYLRLEKLDLAVKSAKKAIKAQPDSVQANSLIALIYQRLELLEKADFHFSKAVEYAEEDSAEYGVVHNNYGVFLCQQDRFFDAEEHFILAADNKLYVSPEQAFENAGLCGLKQNDSKMAERYFGMALKVKPGSVRSLIELAKLNYANEEYLRSRAFIQRYHDVETPSVQSLKLAIQIETQLGAEEEVILLKNKLNDRFPEHKMESAQTN